MEGKDDIMWKREFRRRKTLRGRAHKKGVVSWCTGSSPSNRAGIKFTDYAQ